MTKDKKLIREFEFDNEKYDLVEPSAKIIREAKLKYSIQFTKGIKNGLYVRRALEKQLKENDPDFFKEYDQRRKELVQQMADTERSLQENTKAEELDLLAQMLTLYRAQLMEEDQLMAALYENTADQLAEEERVSYLAYGMVKTKEGNSLKETYDEFIDDLEPALFEQCKYEVLCWQYQLDPNWQDNLPEMKAAKKADKLRKEKEKEQKKETQPVKKQRIRKKVENKKPTTRKRKVKKTEKEE